ncbi:MAG TPA: hypothetical protein PKY77_11355 [Phycisphaerae bacterium]|nr:hypothetical protein [Phycisphaerae bacterium]HRY70318.1 hypothetical protein [Phycisphaerae bacterium]HSA28035.1 hypothetical protein [Phycisphaerae bacterium]
MRRIERSPRTVAILLGPALPQMAQGADVETGRLTPNDLEDGWILLFDGTTPFGWKGEEAAKVEDGTVIVGGDSVATRKLT